MLSRARLHHLRGRVARFLPDTCIRLAYTVTRDEVTNEERVSHVIGETFACRFVYAQNSMGESLREAYQRSGGMWVAVEAVLRLPAGTVCDVHDRWRITHRYGVPLATAENYEVAGAIHTMIDSVLVGLRRVEGLT